MAQQLLNIGVVANDGTGTKLRLGGDIINDNFSELYAEAATPHTGDVTGTVNLTLATVNANVGGFNNPSLVVDAKGRITSIQTIEGVLPKQYSALVDLAAGVVTQKLTTVNAEPWSILILDENGQPTNLIPALAIVGGFYRVDIYSVDAMNDVKIKILY